MLKQRASQHVGGSRPEQKPRASRDEGGEEFCVKCEAVKPRSEFYKGSRASGCSSYCKECSKASARQSVIEQREQAVALSNDLAQGEGVEPGRCRAVLNLGAWTSPRARCSRSAAPGAGGYCLAHVPSDRRPAARALAKKVRGELPFGSARWRAKQQIKLTETIAAIPGLSELVSEQERDAKRNTIGARWHLSLDAQEFSDNGSTHLDSLTEGGADGDVGFVYQRRDQWQMGPDAPWVEPLLELIDYRREIDAMAAP